MAGTALTLALLAILPAPPAAQAVRPVYRTFGDWVLACDNTRTCLARQLPDPDRAADDGAERDAGLDIARDAGPDGAVAVRLHAQRPLDPAGVHVAGRAPVADLPWRRGDDAGEITLSGEAARRFVRGMIDAPALLTTRAGTARLSLRGLAATLLAMDEAQGRIGTVTALVRPGDAPARAVPAAIDPPRVVVGPPAPAIERGDALAGAVRRGQARLLAAHACRSDADTDDAAYPLTPTEAVVVLGCGRFAYQSSVLAFRVPRDRPARATLLILPEPPIDRRADPAGAGEYVNGDYDPGQRLFAAYAKGRGLADCGDSTEWTFDGRAFRLSAFAWQERCGGGSAGDWPVLYRTRR